MCIIYMFYSYTASEINKLKKKEQISEENEAKSNHRLMQIWIVFSSNFIDLRDWMREEEKNYPLISKLILLVIC